MTPLASASSLLGSLRSALRTPAVRRTFGTIAVATALLSSGCEPYSDDDDTEGTELQARAAAGTVVGTDIVMGALIDGDTLAIYQCGGPTTVASHTGWFRGTIGIDGDADGFELQSGEMTLSGRRDSDGLEGELLDAEGTLHNFRLDAIDDMATAGVYIAEQYELQVGVVVQGEGDAMTAQGAACRRGTPCDQVIILAPLTIADGEIDVQVLDDGNPTDLQVRRTLTAPDPS